MQKTIISLVVVIVLIAAGWFFFARSGGGGQAVATVNGETLSAAELTQVEDQLAVEQGINRSTLTGEAETEFRTQALDILISRTLLMQAVKRAGVTAPDEEVETQMSAIREQFEDDAAFRAALAAEGLTEGDLTDQLRTDLAVQTYLNLELGFDSLTATEAEIAEAYTTATAEMEDAPELDEVRDQVRDMVIGQKQQELIAQHLEALRAEAEVEILI